MKNLSTLLSDKHLLKHPFYLDWSAGRLTRAVHQNYAGQYYHHVAAFPRYLSATHSGCEDIASRQALLRNLTEEEAGPDNHPELWLRFAEGLGATRDQVRSQELLPKTRELIDVFHRLSRKSYASGLGALFAYEHQVPEVAASKIDGLTRHYGVTDKRSLEFFEVHREADVYHSQECQALIDALPESGREEAIAAAREAADALWGFLDGMCQTADA